MRKQIKILLFVVDQIHVLSIFIFEKKNYCLCKEKYFFYKDVHANVKNILFFTSSHIILFVISPYFINCYKSNRCLNEYF